MAENAARVPYSGVMPAPEGGVAQNGSGAQPMHIDAQPSAFGGGAAQGLQTLGQGIQEDVNKVGGMIMETAANDAEIESTKMLTPVIAKYRSLEGMAAYNAAPHFEKEVQDINQSIRANLPGGAQRMFDANTTRRSAYMVQDYQTYATTQLKKATMDSHNGIAQTAISQAGDPAVAGSDTQFGAVIGDIKHSVASMMDLQGWGAYTTTDEKTGNISFSDSPQGKQAQTVYQAELDKRTGMAWENRLHSLADQNVPAAYKVLQDNRDKIPGEAQVKLDAFFTPKVRDYNARDISNRILTDRNQQYQSMVSKPGAAQADISDAIHQQESSGKPHDYQIQPGTFAQYAKPGEKPENPADQDAVYGRIISDLKTAYPGDTARQAVAYFSGKGNVAPAGSETPWRVDTQDSNGKNVSSYVTDIQNRTNGAKPIETQSLVPSQADYYRTNYSDIIEQTRKEAETMHPDDPGFADTAVSKVEQHMSATIHGQELAYKADNDTVVRGVNGDFTKGSRPTSIDQLRGSSPEVAAAWDRLTVNNPLAAETIEKRILTSNAKGNYNASNPAGYSAAESRLFLPRSDANAITDEAQLWPLVAEGTLTPKDRDNLAKMLGDIQDPKGKTEAQMKKNVTDIALGQIWPTKVQEYTPSEVKEKLQNARIAIQQADEEAIKAGKTAQQRYSPDSKDFVGNAAKAFLSTPAQKLAAGNRAVSIPVFNSPVDPAFLKLPPGAQFKTPDGQMRTKH